MERRTVLSSVVAVGTVGVAGCLDRLRSDDGDSEEPSHHFELTIQNDHDQRYEVTTEMTDDDEEVVFEQAFTIEPGEGRGFADDFPAGRYVLSVDLAGRTSLRSYWNTDDCALHLVRIDVAADGHVSQHVTCRDTVSGPGPFGTPRVGDGLARLRRSRSLGSTSKGKWRSPAARHDDSPDKEQRTERSLSLRGCQ